MSHWNHIIFVPGPYDYGGGTVELGDVFLSKLVAWSARDRPHITMFCSSSMDGDCGDDVVTRCIYFTGPAVLVVGAPCWPADREAYDNARVYQRQEPWQSDKEAVMEGQIMSGERAALRLAGDLAQIRAILDKDHPGRSQETRVIVTYSCPSAIYAANRSKSPFAACISLGTRVDYKYYEERVDHWIHGAPAKDPVYTMGNITCRHNMYQAGLRRFTHPRPLCINAPTLPPVVIVPPPEAAPCVVYMTADPSGGGASLAPSRDGNTSAFAASNDEKK